MLSQQIENLNKIINTYKTNLSDKDKEIYKLKEQEIFLSKKIMGLEKRKTINISNSIDDKSNTNNNSISLLSAINQETSGEKYKNFPIKIIKRKNNPNFNIKSIFSNSQIMKKKNHQNTNIFDTIYYNNHNCNTYKFKKNKLLNLSKTKNNSMDKNNRINLVNSYERIDNQISRNNTKKNSYLNISKMKANIRNNNYNIQNNSLFMNLNNKIHEKVTLKRKLDDYLMMINGKINNLKNKVEKKNPPYKKLKSSLIRRSRLDKLNTLKNSNEKKKFYDSSLNNSVNFEKMNITHRNNKKCSMICLKNKKS